MTLQDLTRRCEQCNKIFTAADCPYCTHTTLQQQNALLRQQYNALFQLSKAVMEAEYDSTQEHEAMEALYDHLKPLEATTLIEPKEDVCQPQQ